MDARRTLWGFALGVVIVVSACSPFAPPTSEPPPNVYLLQWEQPDGGDAAAKSNPLCPTLLLSSPREAPGYVGASMAYTEEPHRIDYFAHHRWADSPARMLEPLLMRALEQSGLFKAVVRAPTTAQFELRLDTEVLQLVQVFEPTASKVELAVRISVLDMNERRVLIGDVLEITQPANERTPYAGVVAANRAVDRLLTELQELLRPVIEPRCRGIEPASRQ